MLIDIFVLVALVGFNILQKQQIRFLKERVQRLEQESSGRKREYIKNRLR